MFMNMFYSMAQRLEAESTADKGPCFKDFMEFKPPTFSDSTDPIVAENWIKEMERIFRLLRKRITEEDKVDLATYMLKGESLHWWDTVLDRLGEGQSIKWAEFKEEFLAKYFPDNVRYQMERDFMTLTQGNKTVLQYEQEFNRLSRYADVLVGNEAAKTRRFIEGLKPSIRRPISLHGVLTFRRAVNMATICETEDARDRLNETKKVENKRKVEHTETRVLALPQEHQRLNATPGVLTNLKQCEKCGRNHRTEQCKHKIQRCFRCHELGHKVADYEELRT
jgi:hypothetical protein